VEQLSDLYDFVGVDRDTDHKVLNVLKVLKALRILRASSAVDLNHDLDDTPEPVHAKLDDAVGGQSLSRSVITSWKPTSSS
jgi:hypothetical protein